METFSWHLLTFLLNALWQIPVIAGAAALAAWLLPHSPANHRHAVWIVALIASAALPVVSSITVISQPRTASIAFTVPGPPKLDKPSPSQNTTSNEDPHGTIKRTITYKQTTATTVGLAYVLFLSICFVKLLRALIRTALLRRSGALAIQSPVVRQVWARCTELFRLSDIQLLTSAHITTPAAAGFWRRVIMLPESLLRSTNEEELTTAIGHEMAHLARHDFALNVLYRLLYLPISFHPAAWLILRSIEETREMACDELVTDRVLDSGVYARSLVNFAAAAMSAVPKPSYLLGVFDGNILERRVQRLLNRPAVNLERDRLRLAASLAALVLCSVVASGIAVNAHAQGSTDVTQKVKAIEPMMRQLHETEDLQLINQAHQQLAEILAIDPTNQQGLNGMMNLSLWTHKPGEAREWARKIVAAYPKEKTAYFSLGVADWAVAYPAIMAARDAAGIPPSGPPPLPDPARATLRDQYGPTVNEGIQMLGSAIKRDSNYSDAMAYMSLLYRLKAYLAENTAESQAELKKADEWAKKSLAAKSRDHHDDSPLAPPLPPPPPPPPPPPVKQ